MRTSIDELHSRLRDDCIALAERLLGRPTSRSRRELRWGGKGSKSLALTGKHRGTWRDWEAGRGGSMLKLIEIELGLSFPDAIRWAHDWLGEPVDGPAPVIRTRSTPIVIEDADDEAQRLAEAHRIWAEGTPVSGTPAETYLWNRSIRSENWPECLRWHHEEGLIAISTAPDGRQAGIQRIALNSDGTPRKREDGSKIKLGLGPRLRGAVRFPGPQDRPLIVCEGVETAASVWHATGLETWAALGVVSGVSLEPVPLGRKIILCPDDDGRAAQTLKAARDAIRAWKHEGRTILTASPFESLRRDKSDFNDALQKRGPDHVRERIEATLTGINYVRAQNAKPLGQARQELKTAIDHAIEDLWIGRAGLPQFGIRCDVSMGKTEQAINAAVRWIQEGRAVTEDGNPAPVIIAVPTHRLGQELIARIKEAARKLGSPDIPIAAWRGREQHDPDSLNGTMCGDLDAVKLAQKAGADVQESVCKSKTSQCPLYETCAYQRQAKQKAAIWVVAHASLFHKRPKTIGQPSLLIIDESVWQSSLRGLGLEKTHVGMEEIERQPLAYHLKADNYQQDAGTSADLDVDLKPVRRKLLAAIEANGKGPMRRQSLIEAGLTAEECRSGHGLEWQRKVDSIIRPGMSLKAMKERAEIMARFNGDIARLARLWTELARLLTTDQAASGRVSVDTIEDEHGAQHKVVSLRWADEITEGWEAPILHIDATLRPTLARHVLPRLDMRADVSAETPHQKTIAVVGKSFSHSALKDPKAIANTWRQILLAATLTTGKTLAILPKAAEDEIREKHGPIPAHIALAHHGAVQGLDDYRDVSLQLVIGRTQPGSSEVGRMAGVLTGEAVPELPLKPKETSPWYDESPKVVEDRLGQAVTMIQQSHPHPIAEEIRAAICEDQLVQAMGRGRGLNRGPANPLRVELWGDTVPVIAVDEIRQHRYLSKDEEALARGIWVESASDLRRIWPVLGSEKAIKHGRERTAPLSYNRLLYEDGAVLPLSEGLVETAMDFLAAGPHLRLATYQRKAAGAKPKAVVWDPRVVPDIRAELTAKLGALACLEEMTFPAVLEAPEAVPEVETIIMADTVVDLPAGPVSVIHEDYAGGILPAAIIAQVRALMPALGIRQEDLAAMVGISRPQLANALQGRYGLSEKTALRLNGLIQHPPPIRQPDFFAMSQETR